MDKEVEQVMEEIEKSLARDSKPEHWALSPVEQIQFPHRARAVDPPNEAMLKVEGIKAKADPWARFPVAFYAQAEYLGWAWKSRREKEKEPSAKFF